ncbi:uncharacterized protein n4bp2l2 [Tautogolabrus adspersus]
MSHTKSSSTTSNDKETPSVVVGERSEDNSVRNDHSSPDKRARERVLKEVGLTSTTFIGPAFPPEKNTVKSDIEDTLSEFYKELEQIKTPDDANDNNPEKQDESFLQPTISSNAPHSKERHNVREEQSVNRTETDGHQRSSGQTQSSWTHWYRNEPYHPRRLRPDLDHCSGRSASPQNQWHYPQTPTRPPNPRCHRPPFHPPPPLPTFPNPQNPPLHVNQNQTGSGFTNQHPDDSHVPPFPSYPPPNVCSHPSQGFYRDSPQYFDKDERICRYDAHSGNASFEWSTDTKEEWCQFGEDSDWRQRNDSETEQWEHHSQHPDNTNAHYSSLVLILMRGLPGSGKSTLARELLSTGPSGLILSTDDYFAHRNGYHYEAGLLGAAHEWNQRRAADAMHDGRSPIIIDNTNIQAWEMKPYVKLAMDRGYKVDFCEPDTSWKFDPYELEKRNKHGVPQEKIAQMMDRFSFPISIDIVMSSQEPHHVDQRRQPEQPPMMRRNRDFS